MRKASFTFIKNATANLVRGSAGALVALVLPPILVRHMPASEYAVWVLVLQIAAYVNYLNFGLETAIGRYVAYSQETKDKRLQDAVFSTAFGVLCISACISLAFMGIVCLFAPHLFPEIPGNLLSQMRSALFVVGLSIAIGLPASAWNGVAIGMARYEMPALTISASRVLSSSGIIWAAFRHESLVVLAMILAATNLLSYVAQYLIFRAIAPDVSLDLSLIQWSTAKELYSYCLGLVAMSLGMLLVSGFDLVLVGHFQLLAVTPYSVAVNAVALISGALYAVINAMMPHAARLHARGDAVNLGRMLAQATSGGLLILMLTGLPLLVYAKPIIQLWIGHQYVAEGSPILVVLVTANIVRLIGAPYSILLIATGKQSYIKISPIIEGVSNLAISVFLGHRLGAIGVAIGTLLGAFIGIGAHVFYSIPRTRRDILISRIALARESLVAPLLRVSPLLVISGYYLLHANYPPLLFAAAFVVSLLMSGNLLVRALKSKTTPA